jgi:hypothetical protein
MIIFSTNALKQKPECCLDPKSSLERVIVTGSPEKLLLGWIKSENLLWSWKISLRIWIFSISSDITIRSVILYDFFDNWNAISLFETKYFLIRALKQISWMLPRRKIISRTRNDHWEGWKLTAWLNELWKSSLILKNIS